MVVISHKGGPFVIPARKEEKDGKTYQYSREEVNKIYSIYVHITPEPGIDKENKVKKGQVIGKISDIEIGSHLHFEIRHPEAQNIGNWSMVGSRNNWSQFPDTGEYTGYYIDPQKMVDAGLRHPTDFLDANSKVSSYKKQLTGVIPESGMKLVSELNLEGYGKYPMKLRVETFFTGHRFLGEWNCSLFSRDSIIVKGGPVQVRFYEWNLESWPFRINSQDQFFSKLICHGIWQNGELRGRCSLFDYSTSPIRVRGSGDFFLTINDSLDANSEIVPEIPQEHLKGPKPMILKR